MRLAKTRGLHAVPAFHRDLALGVATYALELMSDHPDLDALYVPIGQGSGICGCIAARDALSFAAGHVVRTNSADTLADGMATRVPDDEALEVIARGAARVVLVDDDEIASAIRAYLTDARHLAEGAG